MYLFSYTYIFFMSASLDWIDSFEEELSVFVWPLKTGFIVYVYARLKRAPGYGCKLFANVISRRQSSPLAEKAFRFSEMCLGFKFWSIKLKEADVSKVKITFYEVYKQLS